jgi:hypothetical protein
MNTAIETLVAKWAEPDGIPIKGSLITPDGCMCAQGQALHYVGGWSPERLRKLDQVSADKETARLLDISVAHAVLLRQVNDNRDGAPSVVFTDPAKVLGDQAETVLAFWRHLDRMTARQWSALSSRVRRASNYMTYNYYYASSGARDAADRSGGNDARAAGWIAAAHSADTAAAGYATNEIQGARILRERGQPFTFLPMFGFADPEAILAKEATR